MTDRKFDVVVIGGGIHGAGIAQAAAATGYSVLLLEKSEPAAGTSSRSSKLIHGGLRYLESWQFSLVRESLRERELLLKNAPHLVKLVPFYIPVYRQMKRRPWQIRVGLALYSLLGGCGRHMRFRSIARREWHKFGGLKTDELQAIFRYFDGQTNDAALTRAVLQSARSLGAEALFPAQFTAARKTDSGYRIQCQHNSQPLEFDATVLINAAGPWVNEVQEMIEPRPPKTEIELVQGAHIVLDQPICEGIVYVEAPRDQRAVFVMPWKSGTLVGTTETVFHGSPDDVCALPAEIAYLEETIRFYFPACRAKTVDHFAGLRVLPKDDGSPFGRSRETTLITDGPHSPHYLAVYGGKLTGYRAAAEKVLQKIRHSLPSRKPVANTKQMRLP